MVGRHAGSAPRPRFVPRRVKINSEWSGIVAVAVTFTLMGALNDRWSGHADGNVANRLLGAAGVHEFALV